MLQNNIKFQSQSFTSFILFGKMVLSIESVFHLRSLRELLWVWHGHRARDWLADLDPFRTRLLKLYYPSHPQTPTPTPTRRLLLNIVLDSETLNIALIHFYRCLSSDTLLEGKTSKCSNNTSTMMLVIWFSILWCYNNFEI